MFQLFYAFLFIASHFTLNLVVEGQEPWDGGITWPSCRINAGPQDYLSKDAVRATLISQGFPEAVFEETYLLSSATFMNKTGFNEVFDFVGTASHPQQTFLLEVVQHDSVSYELGGILFRGTYDLPVDAAKPMTLGIVAGHRLLFMLTNSTLQCINVTSVSHRPLVGAWGVSGNSDGGGNPLAARLGRNGYTAFVEHDSLQQVYFTDTENHCIRRYRFGFNDLATIAGVCGSAGNVRGIGVPFTAILLWEPTTLSFLREYNELYLTDSGNDQLVSLSVSATTGSVAVRNSNQLSSVVQFRDSTVNGTNKTASRSLWPLHSVSMRFFAGITVTELTRHTPLQMFGSGEVLFSFEHTSQGCYFIVGKRHAEGVLNVASLPAGSTETEQLLLPTTGLDICGEDIPLDMLQMGSYAAGVVSPKPGSRLTDLFASGWSPIVGFGKDNCWQDLPATPLPNTTEKEAKGKKSNGTDIIVIVVVSAVVVIVAVVAFAIIKRGTPVHPAPAGSSKQSSATEMAEMRSSTENGQPSGAATTTVEVETVDGDSTYGSPRLGVSTMNGSEASTVAMSNIEIESLGLPAEKLERRRALCDRGLYQKNKLLGRGANGSVYSCVLLDGSTVAMKEVLLPSNAADMLGDIQKEVQIVSTLNHPHVVEYYGCRSVAEDMILYIFMEVVSGGSLASMVQHVSEPLQEPVVKIYVRQMVEAVAYIHGKGVVHRDIKCDNVLLTSEGVCKLADFGASKVVGNAAGASRAANTVIGTPFFMAPEILTGAMVNIGDETGYGKKADIWSLGITILELMNRGNPPWPEFPNHGAAFMHIAGDEGVPVIPDHVKEHADAVDFIEKCCVRDPRQRWTADELLNHRWLH